MRLLMVVAFLAVTSGCSSATIASRPARATYTPGELQRDISRIRSVLLEGHPSLNKYRSRPELDSIFKALADSSAKPMTAIDFWRVASIAVAGLRDNHTSIVPNDSIFKALYREPGAALPMKIAVLDERLYILRNYLPDGAQLDGSEIIDVDGMPASVFLSECKRVVPTDGNVALRAARKIERDFDLTCGLLNGMPKEYHLVVRKPSGGEHSITVPTSSWTNRRRLVRLTAPADTVIPPSGKLDFTPDSAVAILALRTFSEGNGFDPREFIDASFRTIASSRARGLIIDLRGNTGGEDRPASRLFTYIARDTFTYYTRREIVKRRYGLLKGTDDWMLNYLLLVIPKRRASNGRYVLRMGMDKPMQPSSRAFKGPVYLLLDGNSVSTSSEFGSVFRRTGRGLILGEESGSALTGGTGATVSVVLPVTRLVLNLPLMTAFIAPKDGSAEKAERGVIPDIRISPTIADRVGRKDPVLDSAVTLANRGTR
jgi:hypothetical protein